VARLVFDEQLESRRLLDGLAYRGIEVASVRDYGMTGRPDPDVVRRIDDQTSDSWVLVTVDLTIIEEHERFAWGRYALAWVAPAEHLRGQAFEAEKANIVHNHALEMVEQRPGDHHTYTLKRHFRSPPSLTSQLAPRFRAD
jgi:hypothetical protein